MKNLIKSFLDTTFDGPIRVCVGFAGGRGYIGVFHDNELITRGSVNDSGDYSYIHWTTSYDVENKINKYIPAYLKDVDSEVMSWVRDKCKTQNITLY